MKNKYFYAAMASVIAVSAIPVVASAQQTVKPYKEITFKSHGSGSYEVIVEKVKEPVVLVFSTGTESFFAHVRNGDKITSTFGSYLGEELYIQVVSADKKTVYDSILFDTSTGKVTFNYDITNYDYSNLASNSYEKMLFTLGEVKLVNPTTNEITFNEIKRAVTLYDFENHAIVQLKPTTTPITYQIPSVVYLLIDSETREEVGELHLNKEEGYTYDPPHTPTYYMYEYKRRVRSMDEDLSQFKFVMPKAVTPKLVDRAAVTIRDSDKSVTQIAAENFISIEKTELKDLGTSSHRDAIVLLNKLGVINGYEDGTFKPSKTLRYSDIIKLVGRYAKLPVLEKNQITTNLTTKYNSKDTEVVSYMKELEAVFGSNISYSKDVTRGEFAIILANFIDYLAKKNGSTAEVSQFIKTQGFISDYVVKNAKYKKAVTALHYFGITRIPDGQFNDDQTLNRGQLASFLTRLYSINFDHLK